MPKGPLVLQDIGHVLSMIIYANHTLECFSLSFGDEEKENRRGFDLQGMEALMQSRLQHLLHDLEVLSRESGITGK